MIPLLRNENGGRIKSRLHQDLTTTNSSCSNPSPFFSLRGDSRGCSTVFVELPRVRSRCRFLLGNQGRIPPPSTPAYLGAEQPRFRLVPLTAYRAIIYLSSARRARCNTRFPPCAEATGQTGADSRTTAVSGCVRSVKFRLEGEEAGVQQVCCALGMESGMPPVVSLHTDNCDAFSRITPALQPCSLREREREEIRIGRTFFFLILSLFLYLSASQFYNF